MNIEEIIHALEKNDHHEVIIPDDWAQGRTVYGGLTAAMIFYRMQQLVSGDKPDESRPVRYMNISFIGPLLTQKPVVIDATLIRTGRSASQLTAQVTQDNKVCVIAQGCFGIARPSKIAIRDQYVQTLPLPKKANFLPQIPKIVPKFLRHFEINLQDGRLPFMHSKKDHLHGWMRFKKSKMNFNDAHLIALIDAWPCTVLQQLKLPAPASTMNWNLEFTQTGTLPRSDQWLAYQASTAHASDGYVFADANVWNQSGELLALSRQTVGVFG